MRNLFFFVLIGILTTITGCVSKQMHEDKLSSWLGAKETELVAEWGPPTGFYELDGKRFLTYSSSSQAMIGGTPPTTTYDSYGNAFTSGGTAPILVTSSCRITMIVETNVVTEWMYEGDGCYDY